jgi:hypothetical protein
MSWLFPKKVPEPPAPAPRPILRVRIQHEMLDNAAIEGLWVGEFEGHHHLRASKTIIAGEPNPFRHGEILVPTDKVVFMEVLGVDANPDARSFEIGQGAEAED